MNFSERLEGLLHGPRLLISQEGGGGSDVKIEKNAKCSISVIDRGAKIITPTELIRS